MERIWERTSSRCGLGTRRRRDTEATLRFRSLLPGCGLGFGVGAFFLSLVLGSADGQTRTADPVNCADPLLADSSSCISAQSPFQQRTGAYRDQLDSTPGQRLQSSNDQVYVDSGGIDSRRTPSDSRDLFPQDPVTDFQRLARSSTGELLPVFGRDLFVRAPSTFAPADQIPVTSDYVLGPGDQLLVRLWGPESFNSRLTIDTTGAIYIPKVGAIHVAGLPYDQVQQHVNTELSRVYKNFNLSISLGQLRSIQVYVVGEARRPAAYTISALSTILNALFISGGPSIQGSLRHIQVRRNAEVVADFDLYDLLLHGDKSKDLRLEQGDTIFIPAAGPQVALAGSVRHPAIYELLGQTSVLDLLTYAGGLSPTADMRQVSLERLDLDQTRKALTLALNKEGNATPLRDGDVLFVNHISAAYETSVTIRGNLANPGRFAWHPGMHLSEIIPDRKSLLTNDYWRERNRLGIPVPLFEPLPQTSNPLSPNVPGNSLEVQRSQVSTADQDLNAQALRAASSAIALQTSQLPSTSTSSQPFLFDQTPNGEIVSGALASPVDRSRTSVVPDAAGGTSNSLNARLEIIQNKINIPTAEIDWSYAVIERLDPDTLKSLLLPFNLGRLVQDHDASQDLELQSGDVVTILSQADITVPIDEQTKFIRLEGEFNGSGIYSVHAGETLQDIVKRAGGLSAKAYLYGSSFFRESARSFQQQRLNEYISTLAADLERAAAVRAASSTTGIVDPNALAQQRSLIAQLRQLRATGRIVLEFQPSGGSVENIPSIALENGDVFRIPSRPSTVSVIGAVYGQNVFLFNADRRVSDYLSLAGKPNRIADKDHAFIIRADGSIYSHERAQGIWTNSFYNSHIHPGDSIVIPEKPIKPTVLRELIDYAQILSSFGLAAAAINVIR